MATSWRERAKTLMQSRGVTQEALAASMSCTRGAVSHYLNGRRSPSLEQLSRIAAVLHADPVWLLFGGNKTGVREGGTDYQSSGMSVPLTAKIRNDKLQRGRGRVSLPTAADCYAVLINGNDYEPRIHAGEAVLIDPAGEPSAGDEIAVYFKDRSMQLHSLLRMSKDRVTVDSVVGEKRVRTLTKRDYKIYHKVVAIFRPV